MLTAGSISTAGLPSNIPASGSFVLTAQYTASVASVLYVDVFYYPPGGAVTWYGGGSKSAPAGTNSVQITVRQDAAAARFYHGPHAPSWLSSTVII